MAKLIPAFGACSWDNQGERRFAERLEQKLEDDYLLWYNVPVGPKGFHPDFIVLHPRRGLAVIEVKDWRIESIHSMDKMRATLVTERGLTTKLQPLEQARAYAHAIVARLQSDQALLAGPGAAYPGKLAFPWTYGVAFTNITRQQFDAHNLGDVISPARVICKDEMTETASLEEFQKRLWDMFAVTFPSLLTLPQVDRIRYHLFPEIRIEHTPQPDLFAPETQAPDVIRIMDIQQEQLARSLGEGHRVIHGVAGSGKTMILGYRCQHLAKVLDKPILVLCYNRTLAARLSQFVIERALTAKVSVYNFHSWCRQQLQLFHVTAPGHGPKFHDECVETVIRAVERGQIPAGQYGAVLIDEGHDFEPEWLKLVAQMVSTETNSLLVLYDDAQSIYGLARPKISFKKLGIQAQGRTTILKLNYRNTVEVLRVAYEFASDVLSPQEADEDGAPLIRPESANRHGPSPEVVERSRFNDEIAFIISRFQELHSQGRAWGDMAVVYRAKFMGEEAHAQLKGAGIPVYWAQGPERSAEALASDTAKVITMHSAKGLEFPIVAIPGIGYLPLQKFDEKEETKLLYVGMTRAMEHLVMTYHQRSSFADKLNRLARAA